MIDFDRYVRNILRGALKWEGVECPRIIGNNARAAQEWEEASRR